MPEIDKRYENPDVPAFLQQSRTGVAGIPTMTREDYLGQLASRVHRAFGGGPWCSACEEQLCVAERYDSHFKYPAGLILWCKNQTCEQFGIAVTEMAVRRPFSVTTYRHT
jgi:hypothetical protein